MHSIYSIARRAGIAAALAGVALLAPSSVRAQEIHEMSEVETMPKFSSQAATSRLIAKSYPDNMKRAGINGSVQLEFVVSTSGKVEPGTVQVVAASVPALGEAAKGIAEKIEFTPGMIKGAPVRTKVILPLVYKAN